MIGKINNNVSFGALTYAPGETKGIINSEFNTPELKKLALDIFEKIDAESTKKGTDIVLEALDCEAHKYGPASRFISAQALDDYVATSVDDVCYDSLDSYGNGVERILTDEAEKKQELQRFGNKVLAKLQRIEPSVTSKLESFRNLFN